LYDKVNRSGLIQKRLKEIHRNLKKQGNPLKRPATLQPTFGPKSQRQQTDSSDVQDSDFERDILLLNGTSSRRAEEIKDLMGKTFFHRDKLRKTNEQSILAVYKKFTECDFMVSYIF
jgi:hypothetical protein